MGCISMWAVVLAASLVVSVWTMAQEENSDADNIKQVEKTDKRGIADDINKMMQQFLMQLAAIKKSQGGGTSSGSGLLQDTYNQDVMPNYQEQKNSDMNSQRPFRMKRELPSQEDDRYTKPYR